MPVIELDDAHELVGVRVEKISLVKRAANRIPIRVMKSEQGDAADNGGVHMNLKSLFRKSDTATVSKPVILAAIVAKSVAAEAAEKMLTEAGLSVGNVDDTDDAARVYFQTEARDLPETALFLKASDHVALAVDGVSKAFRDMNFSSTSFEEVFDQESFFPSIGMMTATLHDMYPQIMQKADSPAEAAQLLGTAIDEFRERVVAMASELPSEAFYVDVFKLDETAQAPDDPEPGPGGDAGEGEGTGEGTDDADEGEGEGDDSKPAAASGDDLAAAVSKAVTDAIAPISTSIEKQAKIVDSLGADVASIQRSQKGLSESLAAVRKTAEDAAKTAGSRVTGAPENNGDDDVKRRVDKSDGGEDRGGPPLIDTARGRPAD